MIDANQCPKCKVTLSPNTLPKGLCPKCLLALALASDDSEEDELIGQIIDEKYLVKKVLGRGGMGNVYLAAHLGTTRSVALKVIAPKFMSNPEFVERFKREAKAAGRLRHPNVVNVTDFGVARDGQQDDSLAYLVMEYLDGFTLSDMIKQEGQLSLKLCVDIIEQICLAVAFAHKQGILHRDLKPGNIWLEPNDRGGYNVKVLDFGLAKLDVKEMLSPLPSVAVPKYSTVTSIKQSETDEASTVIAQTRTIIEPDKLPESLTGGKILGTPLYMSPEQCQGEQLGVGSDIYSLGVIAYQMLTGRTPFDGNHYGLSYKHVNEPPPPIKELRKDIPHQVVRVVMLALEKQPANRPASAAKFATMLRAVAESEIDLLSKSIAIFGEQPSRFIKICLKGYWPLIAGIVAVIFWPTIGYRNDISFFLKALFLLSGSGLLLWSISRTSMLNGGVITPLVIDMLAKKNIRSEGRLHTGIGTLLSISWYWLIGTIIMVLFYIFSPTLALLPLFPHHEALFAWLLPLGICTIITITISQVSSAKDIKSTFFVPQAVLTEGLSGHVAITRSKTLIACLDGDLGKRFPVLGLLNLFLLGVGLLTIKFVVTVLEQLTNWYSLSDSSTAIIAAGYGILLSIILSAILLPFLTICNALLYLKACQSNGETLSDIAKN